MARNEALYNAVVSGKREAAVEAARVALEAGETVESLVGESLVPAMRKVGDDFECGEAFVPEMLIAARAMDAVMSFFAPQLADAAMQPKGRICIGTVKGDLHDIGKNLVAIMLRGAGYEVDDLGVDCAPEKFADAVQRGSQVVCLSALLTTTMPAMKEIVEYLTATHPDVPVLIGGAPITQEYAEAIGAEGYAETANGAVPVVESWLAVA